MKVAELRAELGARGLATAGLKAVLEARLEQAQHGADDANEGAANVAVAGEEDDDEEPMDWGAANPREVVRALSELIGFDFGEAAGVLQVDGDDWGDVDAREAAQALAEHFDFSGGEKLLRKWQLRQLAGTEHDDDDVEEAEA